MFDMNLELAMDVDENMKPEVLEAVLSEADRQRILESKARFMQYIEYYDDITCRGDGIPNLIKLRELMAQLLDTNHGVKNGLNSIRRINHEKEELKKNQYGLEDLVF